MDTDRAARAALVAFVAIGALVLPAAGCDALQSYANPQAPIWLNHTGSTLAIQFRTQLTAEPRPTKELWEKGKPEIDVEHRRVFVGCSDGALYALRAEDGTRMWRFQTLGPVQSEPLYDAKHDVLYFGSNDGALYKIAARDGQLLWRFDTRAEVARKPVLVGDTLFAMNGNDTLIAIEAETGKMRWHQHRTPAFGMEIAGHAGLAVGKRYVYTAFSDGNVMAYAQTDGSEQWPETDLTAEVEQAQGGEAVKYLDADATPIVDLIDSTWDDGSAAKPDQKEKPQEEVVYVASYAGGIVALDGENGSRLWTNEKIVGASELLLWRQTVPADEAFPGGDARPDVLFPRSRKLLVASSGLSGLWGLDPKDGRTLWHRDLPEGGMSAATPWRGTLLVGTTRYGIFLFSPLDGAVIDGIDTGAGVAATPAAFGNKAFVLTNGAWLLGLDLKPPR